MPNDHERAAATGTDDDNFKLVAFKTGNADFDLATWAREWDLDRTGDAVEYSKKAAWPPRWWW